MKKILGIVFALIICAVCIYLLLYRQEPKAKLEDKGENEAIIPLENEGEGETNPEIEEDSENGVQWEKDVMDMIAKMSMREKVGQLFIVEPEEMIGNQQAEVVGAIPKEALEQYPVGGIIYFAHNLISKEQIKNMIQISQSYSKIPLFISIDEEGGRVARVSKLLEIPEVPSMKEIGESKDSKKAYEVGQIIGTYLKELGFNLNFAPIADIMTNTENQVIGDRSFGEDVDLVSEMVAEVVKGLQEQDISATLKHFPGHGDTKEDSHLGYAYSYRTLEELREAELIPFQRGIDEGVDFVMTGHISLPSILKDDTPASLSKEITTALLREELGFEGVIVTDALNMGAIQNHYTAKEAAVAALEAGADIILMPADFKEAFDGVMEAVESGAISEERIEESVRRILEAKIKRGLE